MLVVGATSHAQQISIKDELNAKLAELRDYKIWDNGCKRQCGLPGKDAGDGVCRPFSEDPELASANITNPIVAFFLSSNAQPMKCCGDVIEYCDVGMQKLTVTDNFRFTVENMTFGEPQYAAVPTQADFRKFTWDNCLYPAEHSISETVTFSKDVSDTVAFDRTISESSSTTFNVSVEFKVPFAESATVGASHTISRDVGLTESRSTAITKSVSRSTTLNVNIPPNFAASAEAVLYQVPARVSFAFDAVVDGDVVSNLEGIAAASDVLTLEQRSIRINGSVESAVLSEVFIKTFPSTKISCEGRDELLATDEEFTVAQANEVDIFAAPKVLSTNSISEQIDILGARSCSATNTNKDSRCSITCPIGKKADCNDATGSGKPTCKCTED